VLGITGFKNEIINHFLCFWRCWLLKIFGFSWQIKIGPKLDISWWLTLAILSAHLNCCQVVIWARKTLNEQLAVAGFIAMGGGLVVGGIALTLTIFWHGKCSSWVKLILLLFYHLFLLLLVSLINSSILSEHIICQTCHRKYNVPYRSAD